jgi:UDP-N-acetylmuramate-alanine ligase
MDLFAELKSPNKAYFDDIAALQEYLREKSSDFDCVLVLGAGNLAENLKRNYSNCINYC